MTQSMSPYRGWRERLDKHPVAPPSHLYEGLESRLALHKVTKRFRLTRWVAVAATICLLILAGTALFLSGETTFDQKQYSRNMTDLNTPAPVALEGSIYTVEHVQTWRHEAALLYKY